MTIQTMLSMYFIRSQLIRCTHSKRKMGIPFSTSSRETLRGVKTRSTYRSVRAHQIVTTQQVRRIRFTDKENKISFKIEIQCVYNTLKKCLKLNNLDLSIKRPRGLALDSYFFIKKKDIIYAREMKSKKNCDKCQISACVP